ncbi:hypothetical protein ACTGJ9_018450 [Bradyrhizobium sp. RDM12]
MKMIFAAIGAALRAVISCMKFVLSMPGKLLGTAFGGPLAGPPAGDSPVVEDLARRVAEEDARTRENCRKIAEAIWYWAMDSLIAGDPIAVPTWLPRDVQAWLPGVTAAEAERLVAADNAAVQAHFRGLYGLPGVRKVQKLVPVKWPPGPLYVEPTPGWASQFAMPVPGRAPA